MAIASIFIKKIKKIAGLYRQKPMYHIIDEQDRVILEPDKLLKIWKIYTASLFDDDRPWNPQTLLDGNSPSGPNILESEVLHAIKLLKNNKAPGPDNMILKTFHLIRQENIKTLVKFFTGFTQELSSKNGFALHSLR